MSFPLVKLVRRMVSKDNQFQRITLEIPIKDSYFILTQDRDRKEIFSSKTNNTIIQLPSGSYLIEIKE